MTFYNQYLPLPSSSSWPLAICPLNNLTYYSYFQNATQWNFVQYVTLDAGLGFLLSTVSWGFIDIAVLIGCSFFFLSSK